MHLPDPIDDTVSSALTEPDPADSFAAIEAPAEDTPTPVVEASPLEVACEAIRAGWSEATKITIIECELSAVQLDDPTFKDLCEKEFEWHLRVYAGHHNDTAKFDALNEMVRILQLPLETVSTLAQKALNDRLNTPNQHPGIEVLFNNLVPFIIGGDRPACAFRTAYALVNSQYPQRDYYDRAHTVLLAWVPPEHVTTFGVNLFRRNVLGGAGKPALDIVEIFKLQGSDLNSEETFARIEEGVEYRNRAAATGYQASDWDPPNCSYYGQVVTYGHGHVTVQTTTVQQTEPRGIPLFVQLAKLAEMPQERIDRLLLRSIPWAMMRANFAEQAVSQIVSHLSPAWERDPALNRQFICETMPRALSTWSTSQHTAKALRILRTHQSRLGISLQEIDETACIALVRYLEAHNYFEYSNLLRTASAAQACMTSDNLERHGVGAAIREKISLSLEYDHIRASSQVAPLITETTGFYEKAVASLRRVLASGDIDTHDIKQFLGAYGITPQNLNMREMRMAMRSGLKAQMLKSAFQTAHYSSLGSKELAPAEYPYRVREYVELLGMRPAEVKSAACSAAFVLISEGEFTKARQLAGNHGVIDQLTKNASFSDAIKKLIVKKLGSEDFDDACAIADSSFCPATILADSSISKEAFAAVRQALKLGRLTDAASLVVKFELSPRTLKAPAITAIVSEFDSISTEEECKELWEELPALMEAFGLNVEVSRLIKAAARLWVRLEDYREHTASGKVDKVFDFDKEEVINAAKEVAETWILKGALYRAERILENHDVPCAEFYEEISEGDLESGVAKALSFGISSKVRTLLEDPLRQKEKFSEDIIAAAETGLRAEVRRGDWPAVSAIHSHFHFSNRHTHDLVVTELEEVYANGNIRLVETVEIEDIEISEDDRNAAGVRAILRCLATSDFERVEEIMRLCPEVQTIAAEKHFRELAISRLTELAATGWKGETFNLIARLFALEPSDWNTAEMAEAVKRGVALELKENRFEAVRDLIRWSTESAAEYVAAFSTILPDILQRNTFPVSAVTRVFEVTEDVLQGENLETVLEKRLHESYVLEGRQAEGDYILKHCKLSPETISSARKKALSEFLRQGKFTAAQKLAIEGGFEGETNIARFISKHADETHRFITRWGCQTLLQAIEKLRIYREADDTYTSYARTPTYTTAQVWQPSTMSGYSAEDHKLIEKILNSDTGVSCAYGIPLERQEQNYTCGVASARMAVEALSTSSLGEFKVRQWLGTTEELGTPLIFFNRLRDELKNLDIRVETGGDRDTITALLTNGCVVLINFNLPRNIGPHYAVVRAVSDEGIALFDPLYGRTALSWKDLNWTGGYTEMRTAGGYVAIRPAKDQILDGIEPFLVE